MNYKRTTYISNRIFDEFLPLLSPAELKVLLVIIRQTHGWKNNATGRRKYRDRIAHQQFVKKTGLSSRAVTRAIFKLTTRKLIEVTNTKKELMLYPKDRKGKIYLYYRSLL